MLELTSDGSAMLTGGAVPLVDDVRVDPHAIWGTSREGPRDPALSAAYYTEGRGRSIHEFRCRLCALHVVLTHRRALDLARHLIAVPPPGRTWKTRQLADDLTVGVLHVSLAELAAMVST